MYSRLNVSCNLDHSSDRMEVLVATPFRNGQLKSGHVGLVAWFEDWRPFEDQPVFEYQKVEEVVVWPVDRMEALQLAVASVSNSCEDRLC